MSKKHGLIMIACCLIPLGAAAMVFLFKLPVNNVFIILMFLMCPLSHFLMMGHGHTEEHEHQPITIDSTNIAPKSTREV